MERVFRQEYVVYIVESLERMTELVNNFPDALIYINIDAFGKDGGGSQAWKNAIDNLFLNSQSNDLRIGIITTQNSHSLKKSCLLESCINSTYIELDQGYNSAYQSIIRTFEIYNVKGRRRYVRAVCLPADNVTMSFEYNGETHIADVENISSASVAVRFRQAMILPLHFAIDNVTINFNGVKVKLRCKHFGISSVTENGVKYKNNVFMFDFDLENPANPERNIIYKQIYKLLQTNIK